MAKKLGKVEKPAAEKFKTGRKLFFIPLVFTPLQGEPDFLKLVGSYWEQARAQVKSLEEKLALVTRVYHELVASGGGEGAKAIEALSSGSHQMVKGILDRGAELQPIEDGGLLAEFMDWSRCLSVGLQSQQVFAVVYQSYLEAQKKRNEQIASRIDETLAGDEVGLLLMREDHQIQFPPDIQVFYVAPPGLDAIKRWLRERETEPQTKKGD
jgi:hypothetical protein